jgi:HSF-type DNA-binding
MARAAMDTISANACSVAYPRTGKRGVPQQFARRLYEMLQREANLASASQDYEVLISWSDAGLAFRIHDVDAFTGTVLPKYFRTKKFSSFQRNLNLVRHSLVG